MDNAVKALIDRIANEASRGATQEKETMLLLLGLDPRSEETAHLIETARAFARQASGGRARLAGAIGIDLHSCQMNCKFCSFGEAWGLVKEESILTEDQVIAMARAYVEAGVNMVTLRSTEFYDLNTICSWLRDIREQVPGKYELNLNVGELTPEMAHACYEAGASSAYHVLRMREGIDTPFKPEIRVRTIQAIVDSPLKFNTCIEPIGIEHTDEEIADRMAFALSCHPDSVGIMPRVPVAGTPLGDIEMISRDRMRQMAAILRLAAGRNVKYITMHPDDELGLEAGTNGFSVERGAVPRDVEFSDGEWKGLTAKRAVEILRSAGYETELIDCDPRFRKDASWWRPHGATEAETPSIIGEDGVEYVRRDGQRIKMKVSGKQTVG
ncbi:hypothetical protein [Raoultibacter massiliensis]|uniref:hypothetical protein n=1 Tax=Raoultibacter massiliensis TaxID=1852371 RepID=UPI003A90E07C